jgi:hypothetical protein
MTVALTPTSGANDAKRPMSWHARSVLPAFRHDEPTRSIPGTRIGSADSITMLLSAIRVTEP